MRAIIFFALFLSCIGTSYAQDASNLANMSSLSGNTLQQNKLSDVPMNLFTGMPQVSVPIYNYSNAANGLNWNVSLDYFAGGGQVGESSSTVGLGWFFNSTGAITRTVRGMPDDIPVKGYLAAGTIPSDPRANMNKYYFDSLDSEQDIFEFSFNGYSGKFVIGKNKQIVLIPNSKLKISYNVSSTDNSSIVSFRIISENGTKYDFQTEETTSISSTGNFNFGYASTYYGTAWYLTSVIAPFGTDTIKFNYNSLTIPSGVTYPQIEYVRNSDNVKTATYSLQAPATTYSFKLNSIVFPDKRSLNVIYSPAFYYSSSDYAVAKIKVSDSIFRYGFALDYTVVNDATNTTHNLYLHTVQPYTAKQTQNGYTFTYNALSYVPSAAIDYCKADYWGFYNGVNNGTNLIPQEGSISGANRTPNISYAVANSLSYFYLPGGGYIYYEYELNDHYPYTKTNNSVSLSGNTTSAQSNTVTFNQVFGSKQQVVLTLDPTVARTAATPVSGTGTFTCNVKSTDGLTTYATTTLSLNDLYYLGMLTWNFNVPANGNYQLQVQVASGTSVSVSFPFKASWENKIVDNSRSAVSAGGLRVKRITRRDATDNPNVSIQDFRYVTADGKSSGFLGDTVAYSYPYSETVVNGSTTNTSYTVVSSQPVNTLNYTQGSPVGYSRVVVYNGTTMHNLGYTVYDFTTLADVNSAFPTYIFPYTPQDIRDWGLGLPKKISLYDSSNNLVKRTVNAIQFDTTLNNSSANFLSLKLGNTYTLYNGNPASISTPRTRTFIGQRYYPASGRAYITASYDSLYNTDGSVTSSYKTYTQDTNFNVTKVVISYDKTRGLQLETRMYYPYNYTVGGVVGKLRDSGIISTAVSSESWLTGDANPRIISGTITDFQQTSAGYIKPLTLYTLQSNKPVLQSTIGSFNPSILNRNTTYFVAQASYILYDNNGNLLQTKNLLSGQNNSVIMDYNNEYLIAQISNAAFSDIAYTSFESDGSGNWTVAGTTRDKTGGLTGKQAYNLSSGNVSKSGLNGSLKYVVSFWAKSGASFTLNGGSPDAPIASQNGWSFYYKAFSSITSMTISGSGVIDELRLYPVDATMSTTTYEPLVGTTSVCDANNTVGYTFYDNLNRPKLIKDKDLNVIKRFDYSDVESMISTAPNYVTTSSMQWGAVDSACVFDSTYRTTDQHFWSDTYGNTTVRVVSGVNYCTCSWSSHHPDYKLVNGVCEQASKQYSSCVHKTDGYYCQYHYIWSDCSIGGTTYLEINDTPRTVTSGCVIP